MKITYVPKSFLADKLSLAHPVDSFDFRSREKASTQKVKKLGP